MQSKKNIILSICIPTYNRSKYLNSSLKSIFKQIENNQNVEVIVCDNDSTDNTSEIVKSYENHLNFKYFRQKANVGMSINILNTISLANGEFCWIIGDDDFVLQGAIEQILLLIKSNVNVDFFYAKSQGFQLSEYEAYADLFETSLCKSVNFPIEYELIDNWEELISPKYSIVFMGELMVAIFRKDIWETYKGNPDVGFLTTVENTYIHSVVYANTFFGKKAMYIKTPMILALDGVRDWWDRVGFILIVLVKDLLDLYKEKGLNKRILNDCYLAYIRMTLPYSVKYILYKSAYKDKISVKTYLFFLISHPLLSLKAVILNLISNISGIIKFISPSIYWFIYKKLKK